MSEECGGHVCRLCELCTLHSCQCFGPESEPLDMDKEIRKILRMAIPETAKIERIKKLGVLNE